MASTNENKGRDGTSTVDAEAAIAHIRERGDRVAERESEQASCRLRTDGTLSEREEEAVAALARRLTARLLAVPVERLREASDEQTVRAVLELFGE